MIRSVLGPVELPVRFRKDSLLAVLGFAAVMAVHTAVYRRSVREMMEIQLAGYVRGFGNLMAEGDTRNATDYAEIILAQRQYRRLTVRRADGTLFISVAGAGEANPVNRLFHRIGLIRDRPVRRGIPAGDGTLAGSIEAAWIDRAIHGYLAVGGPAAAAVILALLYRRNRLAREERLVAQLRLEEERTERLLSERKLADAQAQFRELVETANDLIYQTDLYGRIRYTNPVTEKVLRLPQAQLAGRRYTDFVREDHRARVRQFYRRQLRERIPHTYLEFPVVIEDNGVVWLAQNVRLVLRDGRPTGFQSVARDITGLKKATEEITRRDERRREEMNLAIRIHQALLPIHRPSLVGFDFGLRFEPCGEIGGDFIDIVRFNDPSRIGIVFADITGHGVAAALLSAMLKVLVDEIMPTGRAPHDCFRILNRRLAREFPEGNFASAIYAVFDATDTSLTYCKASQEPAIVIRRDGASEILEAGGPALGLLDPDAFGEPAYTDGRVHLRAGDTVFLYTDGLVEIGGAEDQFIGRDELVGWLVEARNLPPQPLVDQVFARAHARTPGGELNDDVALLAARVR